MNRLPLLTALLVLVAATSCHPMHWTRPGFTQGEFNRDSYECERDTRAGAASFGGNIFAAQDFYNQCMGAHGYSLARNDLSDRRPEYVDCARRCVRLKADSLCMDDCEQLY
jgi:hypothetical protein